MALPLSPFQVKLFAWESAVWARLQQLRKREKAALQRLQRLEVLATGNPEMRSIEALRSMGLA